MTMVWEQRWPCMTMKTDLALGCRKSTFQVGQVTKREIWVAVLADCPCVAFREDIRLSSVVPPSGWWPRCPSPWPPLRPHRCPRWLSSCCQPRRRPHPHPQLVTSRPQGSSATLCHAWRGRCNPIALQQDNKKIIKENIRHLVQVRQQTKLGKVNDNLERQEVKNKSRK